MNKCIMYWSNGNHKFLLREAAKKKVHPLVAGPLRPYPPPLSLVAIATFFLLNFFVSLKIAKNGV